jgi:hypothetical protein
MDVLEDTQVTGAVKVFQDITERKRADAACIGSDCRTGSGPRRW